MFGEVAAQLPSVLANFSPGAFWHDREAWKSVQPSLRGPVLRDAEAALRGGWALIRAEDYRQFTRTGNRAEFEALYFGRRRMLNDLVLGELLEARGRFLDAIVDGVILICEESGWQLPAHNAYERGGMRHPLPDIERPVIDLFAAETAAILATVASLLGDRLDGVASGVVHRIEREIQTRVLQPYLTEHFWWMGQGSERMNNWTAWITQNVLLATFCLETEQVQRRQVTEKALGSLDAFIKDYANDGGCEEGVVYYRHAALCMFGAMSILDTVAPGSMASLWTVPKIGNMADYIRHMHVEGRNYINFADSAAVIAPCTAREYLFGRAVGSDALARFAALDRLTCTAPHLPGEWNLWYRVTELLTQVSPGESAAAPPVTEALEDAVYAGIGLYVARDDRFVLAVKAGNNGESHNHNDVGSVTLYKDGRPFLIDVGVETYTAKTFSPARYDIWTMQSAYHNLPTIGGFMQCDGASFSARDLQADFSRETARISFDIAPAYPGAARLRSYRRSVSLLRGREVEIVDIHDGELPAVLSLMTCDEPIVEEDRVNVGTLGSIGIEGGGPVEIDHIEITDARLRQSWPSRIYRLRVPLAGERLRLRIV